MIQKEVSDRLALRFRPAMWIAVSTCIVVLTLRNVVVSVHFVPSDSMLPTLKSGDIVAVCRTAYFFGAPPRFFGVPTANMRWCWSKPQRGDVIALYSKSNGEEKLYVKRILAVAGDIVEWVGDTAFVNMLPALNNRGKAIPAPAYAEPTRVPSSGSVLRLHYSDIHRWKQCIEAEGNTVEVVNGIVYVNGNPTTQYTVKYDAYYVVGDNLEISFDSRYIGVVPECSILGEAIKIR